MLKHPNRYYVPSLQSTLIRRAVRKVTDGRILSIEEAAAVALAYKELSESAGKLVGYLRRIEYMLDKNYRRQGEPDYEEMKHEVAVRLKQFRQQWRHLREDGR